MVHHPSYDSRRHTLQPRGKRRYFSQAELTWLPPQTTLFGVKLPSPILLAPVGVQGILHEDGELATARAAARFGVPLIMSSVSMRSIEATTKADGDGHRRYQLYWPRTDVRLSIPKRANAAAFTTLAFTVDSFTICWRLNDLDDAYFSLAAGVGVQVERPAFPLDMDVFRKRLVEGVEEAALTMNLCGGWLRELASGGFQNVGGLRILARELGGADRAEGREDGGRCT
ncbi:FMN-dependent dehydrogenase domain containing protein [Lactarius tabidus]